MTVFNLQALPSNIPRQRLEAQVSQLAGLLTFTGKSEVTLHYLGGITNHGLKTDDNKLFVRVPGINSGYFINRVEELNILNQLAELNLYPKVIEAYATGPLAGYKVEPFIEGETLQFIDFAKHQYKVLSTLKALHDSSAQFGRIYDIFKQLRTICNTLLTRGETHIPMLSLGQREASLTIEAVLVYIEKLEIARARLFKNIKNKPCHNDITPVNFIHLKHPYHGRDYQLIDWEYAGMNDPMYDIAGVAAMRGMALDESSELVLHYFESNDVEKYNEEIQRVKFYMPLVKLYYAVWAALQVSTGNESTSIDELKFGWGPDSLSVFLKQYYSKSYQAVIAHAI